MEISELLGYFGALIVGLVLGLIGGGGSILTVPIFVYLIGLNPILATAYSLFVVGVTSIIGAFQNFKKGNAFLSYCVWCETYSQIFRPTSIVFVPMPLDLMPKFIVEA